MIVGIYLRYTPHMAILTVLYPKSDHSRFDHSYYLKNHIPFVKHLLAGYGLQRIDLFRGIAATTGGRPSFEMIGNLNFAQADQIGPALQAHATEILADVAKFTDIQPSMQVSDSVSE